MAEMKYLRNTVGELWKPFWSRMVKNMRAWDPLKVAERHRSLFDLMTSAENGR